MLEKLNFIWSKTNRWHRAFLLLILVETGWVPSRQHGFMCNDPALSYPFTGDTISWKWLFGTTTLLPLVVMLLVERIYVEEKATKTAKRQALLWYKEYLYGFLLNVTVVETLKVLVGAPRPHFFDTCGPQEALTCQGSEFVSSYTCKQGSWMRQSDRSFPSGHTSLALHAGLFLAYYLGRRCRGDVYSTRAVASAQAVCVLAAVACSLSRMQDNRHHWWDVLTGALLAAPILFYTINTLCNNFECSEDKHHEKNLEVNGSGKKLLEEPRMT